MFPSLFLHFDGVLDSLDLGEAVETMLDVNIFYSRGEVQIIKRAVPPDLLVEFAPLIVIQPF